MELAGEDGNMTRNSSELPLKMIDNGQRARVVAERLGVGENLLHKWKSARRAGASGLEQENIELRGKVRQLEMERDILKKALSIFSRQP